MIRKMSHQKTIITFYSILFYPSSDYVVLNDENFLQETFRADKNCQTNMNNSSCYDWNVEVNNQTLALAKRPERFETLNFLPT